jgi:hypothetical protein
MTYSRNSGRKDFSYSRRVNKIREGCGNFFSLISRIANPPGELTKSQAHTYLIFAQVIEPHSKHHWKPKLQIALQTKTLYFEK